MDSGSSRLLVLPRDVGGYELRETATGPVLATAPTQDAAIRRATAMLEVRKGGRVLLTGPSGATDELTVVAAKPPWWYQSSPVLRWLFAAVFTAQLVLRLLDHPSGLLSLPYTLVVLLFVVFFDASAIASTVRDRSRRPRPAASEDAVQD